jgi:hypothetical protein
MKTKTLHSTSSASGKRRKSNLASRFVRRVSRAVSTSSLVSLSRLGGLWDPYLLDRLQSPLTRYRE